MKKNKFNFWLIMAALAFSACSQDNIAPANETGNAPDLPTEKATVYFQMNAAALNAAPQTRATQAYDNINNLRIWAFRDNGSEFRYIGEVDKTGITFDGNAFTGEAQLPVGTYKFIPAYGLPAGDVKNFSISSMGYDTPYADNLIVNHLENGILPAVFLQPDTVTVKDYVLGTDSKVTSPKVSLNLARAVARLDIQFVQGEKNADNKYDEKAGPVFGTNTDLDKLTLNLEGLNPSAQLTKGGLVTENITPVNTEIDIDLTQARTDGEGATTIYGVAKEDGTAYDYEAVAKGDFINGSTHIYGPFAFPYANVDTEGCKLTLKLTSTKDTENGQVYTRTIHIDRVPLSRNKVTLVKVYSGGDDIFHTNTGFEIIVNKAWDAHNEISGSVE